LDINSQEDLSTKPVNSSVSINSFQRAATQIDPQKHIQDIEWAQGKLKDKFGQVIQVCLFNFEIAEQYAKSC